MEQEGGRMKEKKLYTCEICNTDYADKKRLGNVKKDISY